MFVGPWLGATVALLGCVASEPLRSDMTRPPAEPTQRERVVDYRPGVRINWTEHVVALEAEVVLREGALELLACSPRTKEHESILRVNARPLHIYEALGLIGLTPGRPPGWDAENERVIPATGDRLDIRIRYRSGDSTETVEAHEWLWDMERERVPQRMSWVFAGSQRLEDGTFYADLDGTVISVVDFSSSLIALPTNYTADNAGLWLEPNPKRVPKEGTRCEVLIRKTRPEVEPARPGKREPSADEAGTDSPRKESP